MGNFDLIIIIDGEAYIVKGTQWTDRQKTINDVCAFHIKKWQGEIDLYNTKSDSDKKLMYADDAEDIFRAYTEIKKIEVYEGMEWDNPDLKKE